MMRPSSRRAPSVGAASAGASTPGGKPGAAKAGPSKATAGGRTSSTRAAKEKEEAKQTTRRPARPVQSSVSPARPTKRAEKAAGEQAAKRGAKPRQPRETANEVEDSLRDGESEVVAGSPSELLVDCRMLESGEAVDVADRVLGAAMGLAEPEAEAASAAGTSAAPDAVGEEFSHDVDVQVILPDELDAAELPPEQEEVFLAEAVPAPPFYDSLPPSIGLLTLPMGGLEAGPTFFSSEAEVLQMTAQDSAPASEGEFEQVVEVSDGGRGFAPDGGEERRQSLADSVEDRSAEVAEDAEPVLQSADVSERVEDGGVQEIAQDVQETVQELVQDGVEEIAEEPKEPEFVDSGVYKAVCVENAQLKKDVESLRLQLDAFLLAARGPDTQSTPMQSIPRAMSPQLPEHLLEGSVQSIQPRTLSPQVPEGVQPYTPGQSRDTVLNRSVSVTSAVFASATGPAHSPTTATSPLVPPGHQGSSQIMRTMSQPGHLRSSSPRAGQYLSYIPAAAQSGRSPTAQREVHSQGVPQGVPPGVPQGMPQGAQGILHGIPHGMAQGVPQGVPQGVVYGVPQGLPQSVPHGASQGLSPGVPQGVGQGVSHGGSQGVSQPFAQGVPHGVVQGVPQGPPQGVAVRDSHSFRPEVRHDAALNGSVRQVSQWMPAQPATGPRPSW